MTLRVNKHSLYNLILAIVALSTLVFCATLVAADNADAKKRRSKKSKVSKRLPQVKSVSPTNVLIDAPLTIKGKYFTVGKNKMLVIFKREGSRRYFAKGTATSKTEMTVIVPDVSRDLSVNPSAGPDGSLNANPTPFPIRLVNRYGMMKKFTPLSKSPVVEGMRAEGVGEDCDYDNVPNAIDTDDDNDLLDDALEAQILTDACKKDTDGDYVYDYYEYRVASDFNGGQYPLPILGYAWKRPTPDPLNADKDNDLDGDRLSMLAEFLLWQYTKFRMDRFYSDVHKDSDGNGNLDPDEDEDHDLLTNYIELSVMIGQGPLRETSFIDPDSDGDGLCDGLDDQDHDGVPTSTAVADCDTAVPNNTVPGDPDPSRIDGDDNPYSNIGELLLGNDVYDACSPGDVFGIPNRVSEYCPLP
jgi:hypothetical protein